MEKEVREVVVKDLKTILDESKIKDEKIVAKFGLGRFYRGFYEGQYKEVDFTVRFGKPLTDSLAESTVTILAEVATNLYNDQLKRQRTDHSEGLMAEAEANIMLHKEISDECIGGIALHMGYEGEVRMVSTYCKDDELSSYVKAEEEVLGK